MTLKTRKTPKETIESIKNKKKERIWIKFPGEGLIDVTLFSERDSCNANDLRIVFERLKRRGKKHKEIHTHPTPTKEYPVFGYLPSREDIYGAMEDKNINTIVVAQTNDETGEVEGYTFLRKTAKTPKFFIFDKILGIFIKKLKYVQLIEKYNLQARYVAADGFHYDREFDKYVKNK
jgi:hypothetical protein